MIRIIICMTFTCIVASKLYTQDSQFSQFYATPLYTNPAKAGTDFLDEQQTARFGLQYLNYWDGLFKTINLSYDQKIDKLHGGVGINANSTRHGLTSGFVLNRYELFYSLHSVASKKHNLHLNSSAGLGLGTRTFEGYTLSGPGSIPEPISSRKAFPILNMGILFYGNKFHVGAVVHNINEPISLVIENYKSVLVSKLTLHAGYAFTPCKNWKIIPQALFTHQNYLDQITTGTTINHKKLSMGVWYRSNIYNPYSNFEIMVNNIGYQYKNFKFMYSIDYPITQTLQGPHYSHEVSLIYSLKSQKPVTAKCSALY